VRPNGTDDRRELIDSSSTEARRFSCPRRTIDLLDQVFVEQYQELVVYDLSTEDPADHERQNSIRDVCWAPNGYIIFSSKKRATTISG